MNHSKKKKKKAPSRTMAAAPKYTNEELKGLAPIATRTHSNGRIVAVDSWKILPPRVAPAGAGVIR